MSHYYDPMLAKLIALGSDRAMAIARLEGALRESVIDGVRTNLPLLLWIARDDAFRAGETTTSFLDQRLDEKTFAPADPPNEAVLLAAAALLVDGRAPWRVGEVGLPLRLQHGRGVIELTADARADGWLISGDRTGRLRAQRSESIVHARFEDTTFAGPVTYAGDHFHVHLDGLTWSFTFAEPPSTDSAAAAHGAVAGAHVAAPMPGKIVKVSVREGESVEEHALLLVLEAMKMEHRIEAPAAAVVSSVLVKEGQIVAAGTPLVTLSAASEALSVSS